MNLMHLNRSVNKNFNQLTAANTNLPTKFSMLGTGQTQLGFYSFIKRYCWVSGLGYTVKIDKFIRESETFMKGSESFNKRNSIKGNRYFYKGVQFFI